MLIKPIAKVLTTLTMIGLIGFSMAHKVHANGNTITIHNDTLKDMTFIIKGNDGHQFSQHLTKKQTVTFGSPQTDDIQNQAGLAAYSDNGSVACSGGRFTFNQNMTFTINTGVFGDLCRR